MTFINRLVLFVLFEICSVKLTRIPTAYHSCNFNGPLFEGGREGGDDPKCPFSTTPPIHLTFKPP